MARRVAIGLCCFLLACTLGCGDTAEALEAYLLDPPAMADLVAEEARIIDQFNGRINKNPDSPDRAGNVATLLNEEILPPYRTLVLRMNGLSVQNKRVRRLHANMLEICAEQQRVLENLADLVQNADFQALSEVNQRLASLRLRRAAWERELRDLCQRYEVTRPTD